MHHRFDPTGRLAHAALLGALLLPLAACDRNKTDGADRKPLPNVPATVPVSATAVPPGIVAVDAAPAATAGASGAASAGSVSTNTAAASAPANSGAGGGGNAPTSAESSQSKSTGPGNGSTAIGGMAGGQSTGGPTGGKPAPTAGDGTNAGKPK